MFTKPPVSIVLEESGIPHRIFRHVGKLSSVDQAASERGQKQNRSLEVFSLKSLKANT